MKWLTIIALLMTQLPLAAVDWGKFIGVVAELESNNGLKRVGDNGKAIGLYQMHKIWVDDYNRITRGPKFSYADRADDVKAARMMHVVLLHYHRRLKRKLGRPLKLAELFALIPGGPDGYKLKRVVNDYGKRGAALYESR